MRGTQFALDQSRLTELCILASRLRPSWQCDQQTRVGECPNTISAFRSISFVHIARIQKQTEFFGLNSFEICWSVEPLNFVMTETSTIWAHGSSLLVDFPNPPIFGTGLARTAQGTTLSTFFSMVGSLSYQAIATIPTPSFLLGKPVVATSVLLKFKTVNSQIDGLTISDGQTNLELPTPDPLTSTSVSGHKALSSPPLLQFRAGWQYLLMLLSRDPDPSSLLVSGLNLNHRQLRPNSWQGVSAKGK